MCFLGLRRLKNKRKNFNKNNFEDSLHSINSHDKLNESFNVKTEDGKKKLFDINKFKNTFKKFIKKHTYQIHPSVINKENFYSIEPEKINSLELSDETNFELLNKPTVNDYDVEDYDDYFAELNKSDDDYNFLCTNVSPNLSFVINDKNANGINFDKTKMLDEAQEMYCKYNDQQNTNPKIVNEYIPPETHGLINSQISFANYYLTNKSI